MWADEDEDDDPLWGSAGLKLFINLKWKTFILYPSQGPQTLLLPPRLLFMPPILIQSVRPGRKLNNM